LNYNAKNNVYTYVSRNNSNTDKLENNTQNINTFLVKIIKNNEECKITFSDIDLSELNEQLKTLFNDGILNYDEKNNVYTYNIL